MSKKVLLENLSNVATAIAEQFSPFCEVVIHDLSTPENSIIFIAGDVTGRCIGGPMTDFALRILREQDTPEDVVGYTAHTTDGKLLKSSTIFVRNQNGTPIGVFCVNFDTTQLHSASKLIADLATASVPLEVDKSFSDDTPHLLQTMIKTSLQQVLKHNDFEEFSQDITVKERRAIITHLDQQGAFRIRKATDTVADFFDVSRYTIYKDLKIINGKK